MKCIPWNTKNTTCMTACVAACSLAVVVESAHITIAYTIGWPCFPNQQFSAGSTSIAPPAGISGLLTQLYHLYALLLAGVYMVRHFLAGSSDQRQVGTLTGLLVWCSTSSTLPRTLSDRLFC